MKEVEKRVFTVTKEDGEKVKVSTRKPTNQEIEDAGMEYSKEFTRAVRFGLMPREAMKAILLESGVWTKKEDDEIKNLEEKIIELEVADVKKGSDREKEVLSKVLQLRESLVSKRKALASYLEHTAEAKAYEAQRDYIVCSVTEYDDTGERVWPGLTFKDEESGEMVFRATYEHMTFVNDVPSQIEESIKTEEEEAQKDKAKKSAKKSAKLKKSTAKSEEVEKTEEVLDEDQEDSEESPE